jgi:PAS domain S-box-containing protein
LRRVREQALSRPTRVVLLGIGLIVAPLAVLIWLEAYQLLGAMPAASNSRAWVQHSFEVITATHEVEAALNDAERSKHSYVLEADPTLLTEYREARAQVVRGLARLKTMTADNVEQALRWPDIERVVDTKLDEMDATLAARQTQGYAPARALENANSRRHTMSQVAALIETTIQGESALLARRVARTAFDEQRTHQIAWASSALALIIMGIGAGVLTMLLRGAYRGEAALRSSEQRMRFLVDGLTEHALYMIDPQGNINSWNTGAERVKGYNAAEILGQNFARFYTEEDREAGLPQRAIAQARSAGKFEAEGWRVRKNGSRFWASVAIVPLHTPGGRLIGFAKLTRDMSERREQQQALESARAALVQSQKMEALGQLSGGIAHDYNNLLHVIRNAVELLGRRLSAEDPEAQRLIEMIKRNAERAATLTQRLLAFSRRQPLEVKAVDPNRLVGGMAELVRSAVGEGIEMETVLAAGVWPMLADANQLEAAILNLAVNARDAMPEGGKLTVETANMLLDESYAALNAEVQPGQYVMISVSDTGVGMSPDVAARALDPFFTTKEVGKGTGLGLSQVYGFIKQSGGHLKLYSEPGAGTTVKLYLPRAPAEQAEESPRPVPALAIHAEHSILVVEDEEDVRAFTVDVLRDLGYRVLAASDGPSALRMLEQESVSLLFTDVGLPNGMNGRQLAEEAQRRRPQLKVLFTTGYARNAIVHHGHLDPGVELIVKPFTPAKLAARITRTLNSTANVS